MGPFRSSMLGCAKALPSASINWMLFSFKVFESWKTEIPVTARTAPMPTARPLKPQRTYLRQGAGDFWFPCLGVSLRGPEGGLTTLLVAKFGS
jgi:hypothetical protein